MSKGCRLEVHDECWRRCASESKMARLVICCAGGCEGRRCQTVADGRTMFGFPRFSPRKRWFRCAGKFNGSLLSALSRCREGGAALLFVS